MQHQCSNELRDPHIKHRSNKRTNLSSETSHFYTPYRIAVHMQHIFAHINAERAFGLSSFQKQPVWFSIQAVFVRAGGQCPLPITSGSRRRGLSPHSLFTPLDAASVAQLLPALRPRIRNRNTRPVPASVTGAHRIKVFGRAFFKKIAGRGQRPRRSPQRAEHPSVQELGGLGDLRKKSPFLNNIREADTSLRTCISTFIFTCKCGHSSRHTNATFIQHANGHTQIRHAS